jgi:hypothetical protein
MPAEIQEALDRTVSEPTDGKLRRPFTPRHAGVVAQLDDEALRRQLIDAVFGEHLSVAEANRRKAMLVAVAEAVPTGEARVRLEAAVVDGLSEKDLNFRLAAYQAPERPARTEADAEVAVERLAVAKLLGSAQDGTLSAAKLLKALNADRALVKALLSGNEEA